MFIKKLMLGGQLPEGCIHFKTSKAIRGVNFFTSEPDYDFSSLQVYINDELTNVPANSLTANAGDDIKIVSRSKPYPFFYPYKDYIASIEEPFPFMGRTNFSNYFSYSRSLVSIPENLFINNPQITSFASCFYYCTSLTSIPQGLFDNNTNVTNFSYCFYNCTSLTSIPVGLFDKNLNVTDFSYCFERCEKLKVNVQIGSTVTNSVDVGYFAYSNAAKGTVYCRAGSNAYNAFLESTSANVNVRTY